MKKSKNGNRKPEQAGFDKCFIIYIISHNKAKKVSLKCLNSIIKVP